MLKTKYLAAPIQSVDTDLKWLVYKFAKTNADAVLDFLAGILPLPDEIAGAVIGYILHYVAKRYLGYGIAKDVLEAVGAGIFEESTDRIFGSAIGGLLAKVKAAIPA